MLILKVLRNYSVYHLLINIEVIFRYVKRMAYAFRNLCGKRKVSQVESQLVSLKTALASGYHRVTRVEGSDHNKDRVGIFQTISNKINYLK